MAPPDRIALPIAQHTLALDTRLIGRTIMAICTTTLVGVHEPRERLEFYPNNIRETLQVWIHSCVNVRFAFLRAIEIARAEIGYLGSTCFAFRFHKNGNDLSDIVKRLPIGQKLFLPKYLFPIPKSWRLTSSK